MMPRIIEAVVESGGQVRLLEEVSLPEPRRALVTILDEAVEEPNVTALLSEAALAEDWNREEEDAAWEHLQPEK
jgi:predicted DNA-binding antitoxin AbrB/MazE fold protein